MAGALDSLFSSLSKNLIGTFGTGGKLISRTAGTYDPETGLSSGSATTEYAVNCSPPEKYSRREIDGTRILDGDLSVMVASADYATKPTTAMTFAVRGQTFGVISVEPISSGNQDAVWKLQLRRQGAYSGDIAGGGGLLDGVFGGLTKNLIGTFGTTGYMITTTGSGYNPATGDATAGEDTETAVNCSPPYPYRDGEIDGTRIKTGDVRVILARADWSTTPVVGDRFSVRGSIYGIVAVDVYSSGNLDAAWELQLRYQGRRQVCVYDNVTVGGDLVTVGGEPVTVKVCA